MGKSKSNVTLRQWLIFVFVGLAGQFAWSIENMYLNSYLYYLSTTGTGFDPSPMVAWTTALSAITATLTTIFMGSLTDKVRKRKIFIALGYVLWGIATASFGLVDVGNAHSIVPVAMAASTAAVLVIVIDCVMTFLGSTANDAAFNSYVTRNVQDSDRGKVEGVLSILPLVAMLIIFVGLNGLTANGQWDLFFYIIGGVVTLVGLVSFVLVPKEAPEETRKERLLPILAEGFLPKTVKSNKNLYLVLLCYFVYGVAIQVFFPYLMVYVEKTAGVPNTGSSFLTPFAMVMAVALLLGSAGSVLVGFLSDLRGKVKMILPTTGILALGLLLLFFAPDIASDSGRYVYTAFSGMVMILGYVAMPTILNSLVRDFIPKGKEGAFMGVRMVFVVALPMCIGPFIGDALNQQTGAIYTNEYGVESAMPSQYGYLVGLVLLALIVVPYFFLRRRTRYDRNEGYLVKELIGERDLPEVDRCKCHPRPSFARAEFLSLEGFWDCQIDTRPDLPSFYQGRIRVPFAVESPLSGVNHRLLPKEYLFYHRHIDVPEHLYREHLYLCFEGVDQFADVFVNGRPVGSHEGGYTRFRIDIRPFLNAPGFDLVVRVRDLTDSSFLMTGKQRLSPNGWFYSSSSGIVKSVYLEASGAKSIENLSLIPDFDGKCIHVLVQAQSDFDVQLAVSGNETRKIRTNERVTIPLSVFRPWSPADPYLYDVRVSSEDDEVTSYFGVRKIEIGTGKDGKRHIYLNGQKVFLNGLLDQGYYPFGGLTAESIDFFQKDIQNTKILGFNCLRMHVKVEEDLFYYFAAKEGLLLIQDIPNGGEHIPFFNVVFPRSSVRLFNHSFFLTYSGYGRKDEQGRKQFIDDALSIVRDFVGNPAVVVVTLFNEAWGEFQPDKVYSILKQTYPMFLFDTASGWLDSPKSDLFSVHSYTVPHLRRRRAERPYVLTEIGGASLKIGAHYIYPKVYGHHVCRSAEAFNKRYRRLYEGFFRQIEEGSLNGLVYTQLNDCETEANGLYTLDREWLKADVRMVHDINIEIDKLSKE